MGDLSLPEDGQEYRVMDSEKVVQLYTLPPSSTLGLIRPYNWCISRGSSTSYMLSGSLKTCTEVDRVDPSASTSRGSGALKWSSVWFLLTLDSFRHHCNTPRQLHVYMSSGGLNVGKPEASRLAMCETLFTRGTHDSAHSVRHIQNTIQQLDPNMI